MNSLLTCSAIKIIYSSIFSIKNALKKKKAMLSIPSFEMKRPLSHEDKCKGSMFDYF